MKTYKGTPIKNSNIAIGALTDLDDAIPRGNFILYKDKPCFSDFGFSGYIAKIDAVPPFAKSGVHIDSNANFYQHIGDIVQINNDGQINILWEKKSTQNALYLTDTCNVDCVMCPQPQKPHNKIHLKVAHRILDLLSREELSHMCITGGEPTLLKDDFLKILERCTSEHPRAYINILTNGQTLSNLDFAKQCAIRSSHGTCYCVSMHGDSPVTHDKIVQKNGAFGNVHRSLYNLSKLNVGIEVRFVISKINYKRLPNLADFFFRSYPFVHHFALMGLEMTGWASKNSDIVWIDPVDYQRELEHFVVEAERRGLNFSIYNHQLCTLPKRAWKHARQSISEWKQNFISACETCEIQGRCGGFFATSKDLVSRGINPVRL
jgi:His-Xaa-Ser system radical SAM maturase HxsC